MQEFSYFESEIYFDAGPARVWDALTNPEKTRLYMYGAEIRTDWEEGNPITWEVDLGGQRIVAVQGQLLQLKVFKLLEFTVFVPNAGIEDVPENYITTTYALHREGDRTRLHVRQGDYAKVANGKARFLDTANIWKAVTAKLIAIAESREG
jgi:uncharacterized protein YndB with AHSA1/START domain